MPSGFLAFRFLPNLPVSRVSPFARFEQRKSHSISYRSEHNSELPLNHSSSSHLESRQLESWPAEVVRY